MAAVLDLDANPRVVRSCRWRGVDLHRVPRTAVRRTPVGHPSPTSSVMALLALVRHPDQLDLLRARPDLMASAVEELLRYDSPVRRVARIALDDAIVDGQQVRAGEQVIAMLDAANHD